MIARYFFLRLWTLPCQKCGEGLVVEQSPGAHKRIIFGLSLIFNSWCVVFRLGWSFTKLMSCDWRS